MTNPTPQAQRAALFKDRQFKWLLSGGVLSMLGDQFTLIALPWLVLTITSDTFVLGTVLALIGIPRALFMLIGGALVDRLSPKRVLMWTKHVNTVLLGVLAALVLGNALTLPLLYALSLAIGLAGAFSIPSASAMLPNVVASHQLQAANSTMLAVRQLTMIAGPLLAGAMIAVFSDARGTGIAFALDALSFAISAWTLAKVDMRPGAPAAGTAVLRSVLDNLQATWRDVDMRTCFLYWAAIAFFISGPLQVAMPVMASQFDHAAASYGVLMGAHGAGTLIGMVVSGMRPTLRFRSLGATILLIDGVIGTLIAAMGLAGTAWLAALLLLTIGTLGGFLHVAVFTWMQRRVPPSRMGRTMSLFMFIFLGIAPVSATITGYLMRTTSVAQLFAGSGVMMCALVALALVATPMRRVTDGLTSPSVR